MSLIRKISITAASVALMAGGSLTLATPAFASTFIQTRYANGSGNTLVVASMNLSDGTAVTGNSASFFRIMDIQDQHFVNGGHEVYRIAFHDTSNPQRCIGLSSAGNATIRDCLGNQNNTNWQAQINNGDNSVTWINNTYTSGCIGGCILTSSGTGGTQLFGASSGSSGFQKWTPQP